MADAPWDLVVIGGGTAGIVAAKTAARLGARVALVERDRTGGDCLWTGCVPSKALLAAAAVAAGARNATDLGVTVDGVNVDFGAVMKHVHGAVAAIEPVDSPAALERAGVTVLAGSARFTGPRSVEVDARPVPFRRALIATGSSPAVPGIPGLREAGPLTSDTVWDLTELPRRLVVLGGGSIGCELGQAFARLGSDVTVVEASRRLLPNEDPDASQLVEASLRADGVTVLTGHRATRVDGSPGGSGQLLVSEDHDGDGGGPGRAVAYDALLVAVGRRPGSRDLGLDLAGVAVADSGHVEVDARLRTTNERIWAAGDVTPHPQFTHVAGVHGSMAASNAVLGLRRQVDLTAVPRVTYTDPEVAAVGAPSFAEEGPAPTVVTRSHDEVDRAVTEGRTDGFSRLVLDRRHKVVGATLVGPRAGESLAEVVLAIRKGLGTGDLSGTTHAYPTYGDGPWNAAIADTQARLDAPGVRFVTSALTRVRRWTTR